jgi:hypothetical protein
MRGIFAIVMSMFVVVSPAEARRFVALTEANKEAEGADASGKDFNIQNSVEVRTDKEMEELVEKIKGKKAFKRVEYSKASGITCDDCKMLIQDGMLEAIKSEMETNKDTFTIMQFFQLQGLFEGDAKDEVSALLQPYVRKPVKVEGISDADFDKTLKRADESWADERVPIYKDVCRNYAFTCAQVVKFIELETWGDESLMVLQAFTEARGGKGCISDPQNKIEIIKHFRDEFEADAAEKLLNKLRGAKNAIPSKVVSSE